MNHPAWIEVNLTQFRKNLSAIRRKIGGRKFCLPVKSNAYGHGLCKIAQVAQEAKVDCLGVAFLKEAVELRKSGITIPILIFGAIHEEQIPHLLEYDLEFSISSKFKAERVVEHAKKLQKQYRVHLEVDTGIHRTGVRPETAVELLRYLKSQECFQVVGIYSHFATADVPENSFAKGQIATFQKLAEKLGDEGRSLIWHLANSGGVLFYPDSLFDMVRPGMVCYGYFPNRGKDPNGEIAPCFSLKARVSYFKVVSSDTGISYGHLYRTQKQARIVTVPLGYGDGYRRILSNQAPVLIRGERFRVSGAICMDQFMVDIGEAECYVGEEVTLIGKQGSEEIYLEEIAQLSGSIYNEVLCGFNDRLPRIYVD